MYYNDGWQITNTPTNIVSGYTKWPYYVPPPNRYQKTLQYYTDYNGNVRVIDSWNKPTLMRLPGRKVVHGTPTKTGTYVTQNIGILQ
jgi:hypothetical protein